MYDQIRGRIALLQPFKGWMITVVVLVLPAMGQSTAVRGPRTPDGKPNLSAPAPLHSTCAVPRNARLVADVENLWTKPPGRIRVPARDERADTVAGIEYAARMVTGDGI